MDIFKCLEVLFQTNFETLYKMEPENDLNIREEIVMRLAELFNRLCHTEDGENIFVVMLCFILV